MLDIVLFVIFPYAAVLLAVGGSLYRYLTNQFSYSSMSSQFLENENLFWGSTLWHYGVLPTLLIHLAGIHRTQGDGFNAWHPNLTLYI